MPTSPGGLVALIWGAGGFLAMLGFGVYRLSFMGVESLQHDWTWPHYGLFVANMVFMGWAEGYRGFQCSYAPRFAARAAALGSEATPLQAMLSPLISMGFLAAPRRRVVAAWLLTVGIIVVVLIYRLFPQPWRGILDAGVALGLGWGMAATAYHLWYALRNGPRVDPELTVSSNQ